MFINASEYLKDRVQCSYGATFKELRIHRRTQEILVHQMVGAYSFGAILNSKAARSQLTGAQIFGSSSAMPEATQSDKRSMRSTNDNLAKYMIRVNADIARHEVTMIPKKDFVINYLGLKSVGVGQFGREGTCRKHGLSCMGKSNLRTADPAGTAALETP
jgi:xanthine dehydrogenase YagR molybdenum-binding subunit